ncbi:DUF4827 family protein [Coprobacter tertius]|uniref:DUF4827 domain-containing protein n=1 Tax=Coprobacter tertius TaxID=2944915 RepID=A0ABT1MIU4_9BACT|nr:DUF4827 family protein [Coprobacter tertius]MCP9611786.1 DUF4827 domain-containing protein [Coprobacter tertius]
MKIKFFYNVFLLGMAVLAFSSCGKDKTYAEKLKDEKNAINKYLDSNGYRVADIPANLDDLETTNGDWNSNSAPFYRLEDGVYMQVVSKGDMENRFQTGERVYLWFDRLNLLAWASDPDTQRSGNKTIYAGEYFDYGNSSSSLGAGIEKPIDYLGRNSKANVIVPSKQGSSEEAASVIPFLWSVEYREGKN